MAHQQRETQKRDFSWKGTLFWAAAVSFIVYVCFFFDQSQGKLFSWQFALSHLRHLIEKCATASIRMQRDRPAIYRHRGPVGECDPDCCPPHHWQKEGNLTLIAGVKDRDYRIIRQKRPRRYLLFVNAQLARNEWFPSYTDSTQILQIRHGHEIFLAYLVLVMGEDDRPRPLTRQGYATYQQALDNYFDLDGEASSNYERWLFAEGDWHEQEREARVAQWDTQYDSRYVEHLLANWDTQYYNEADEYLRGEITAGLHDENVRQRDEQNRRALARRYCSSPDAPWIDIADAIRRQREALQAGLPASASWQQIEEAWQHQQQNFGTNEITPENYERS